jgi:sugar (pentulose or hexulose) kinase
MSRSRGLPRGEAASALSQVLDTLTDPVASDTSGNPNTPGTPDISGTGDAPGASVTSVPLDAHGTSVGASGTSGTSSEPDTSERRPPTRRTHVKLRNDLACEVRDAVWFLSEHGRPRVQLGELLDEAIEAWLAEAKKTYNEGQDFPHRGLLR